MELYDFDSNSHGANATYNASIIEEKKPLRLIELINLYGILPIVVLGTTGNLLSIAVFRCTKLRRVSASYYLSMLSISDTGFLLNLFAMWLNMVGISVYNQPFLCQFFHYLTYVCSFLSPWLIVIFTIERFVATCYPLWRAFICTVARAKAIVVILVCVASLSYLYIPFVAGLQLVETAPNSTKAMYQCVLKTDYLHTMSILNILDMVFALIVPVILIIVLNIMIARAIWHFEHVRRHMTMTVNSLPSDECNSSSADLSASNAVQLNFTVGKGTQAVSKQGRSRNCGTNYQVKITKMLLIISSVFIGLNAPSYILRIIIYAVDKDNTEPYMLVQEWCQLGYYLNFAINFLLYCVSGQNFRKSLKSLLWKVTHRAKHRQLSRSNTGTMIANCNNSTISSNTMAIGLISACQPCQTSVKSAIIPEETLNNKDVA